MSDQAVMKSIEIPGMKITYQAQAGDGRMIAYEIAEDRTIDKRDLDDLFDRIGGAVERQQAKFELPLVEANLFANRELLRSQRRERANAEARAEAKIAHLNVARRKPVEIAQQDANSLSQFDQRIVDLERQIKNAERRIPYLKALIAGETPPSLFPEAYDNDLPAAAD